MADELYEFSAGIDDDELYKQLVNVFKNAATYAKDSFSDIPISLNEKDVANIGRIIKNLTTEQVAKINVEIPKKELQSVTNTINQYLTKGIDGTAFRKKLLQVFNNSIDKLYGGDNTSSYNKMLVKYGAGKITNASSLRSVESTLRKFLSSFKINENTKLTELLNYIKQTREYNLTVDKIKNYDNTGKSPTNQIGEAEKSTYKKIRGNTSKLGKDNIVPLDDVFKSFNNYDVDKLNVEVAELNNHISNLGNNIKDIVKITTGFDFFKNTGVEKAAKQIGHYSKTLDVLKKQLNDLVNIKAGDTKSTQQKKVLSNIFGTINQFGGKTNAADILTKVINEDPKLALKLQEEINNKATKDSKPLLSKDDFTLLDKDEKGNYVARNNIVDDVDNFIKLTRKYQNLTGYGNSKIKTYDRQVYDKLVEMGGDKNGLFDRKGKLNTNAYGGVNIKSDLTDLIKPMSHYVYQGGSLDMLGINDNTNHQFATEFDSLIDVLTKEANQLLSIPEKDRLQRKDIKRINNDDLLIFTLAADEYQHNKKIQYSETDKGVSFGDLSAKDTAKFLDADENEEGFNELLGGIIRRVRREREEIKDTAENIQKEIDEQQKETQEIKQTAKDKAEKQESEQKKSEKEEAKEKAKEKEIKEEPKKEKVKEEPNDERSTDNTKSVKTNENGSANGAVVQFNLSDFEESLNTLSAKIKEIEEHGLTIDIQVTGNDVIDKLKEKISIITDKINEINRKENVSNNPADSKKSNTDDNKTPSLSTVIPKNEELANLERFDKTLKSVVESISKLNSAAFEEEGLGTEEAVSKLNKAVERAERPANIEKQPKENDEDIISNINLPRGDIFSDEQKLNIESFNALIQELVKSFDSLADRMLNIGEFSPAESLAESFNPLETSLNSIAECLKKINESADSLIPKLEQLAENSTTIKNVSNSQNETPKESSKENSKETSKSKSSTKRKNNTSSTNNVQNNYDVDDTQSESLQSAIEKQKRKLEEKQKTIMTGYQKLDSEEAQKQIAKFNDVYSQIESVESKNELDSIVNKFNDEIKDTLEQVKSVNKLRERLNDLSTKLHAYQTTANNDSRVVNKNKFKTDSDALIEEVERLKNRYYLDSDSPYTQSLWEAQIRSAENRGKAFNTSGSSLGSDYKQSNYSAQSKMLSKATQWVTENTRASSDLKARMEAVRDALKNAVLSAEELKVLGDEINKINVEATERGEIGLSTIDKIAKKTKDVFTYMASFVSVFDIFNKIKEGINIVEQLNTSITELAKVSGNSSKQIEKQFDSFVNSAKEVGGTISEAINVTTDWSRLGYSLSDAQELAKVAMVYKNVGGGISIDEANTSLVSTIKGFGLSADDAMSVVDKFTEVANKTPIDAQGIGDALQRSAASFKAANTDLSESMALITGAKLKIGSIYGNIYLEYI